MRVRDVGDWPAAGESRVKEPRSQRLSTLLHLLWFFSSDKTSHCTPTRTFSEQAPPGTRTLTAATSREGCVPKSLHSKLSVSSLIAQATDSSRMQKLLFLLTSVMSKTNPLLEISRLNALFGFEAAGGYADRES